MNTQSTEKSIKATNGWKNVVVLTAALAILLPILGKASSIEKSNSLVGDKKCLSITNRPLSHFLDTQGTLNNPPQFFPDVKDYVGWADNPQINFALIDYAGLANKYIKDKTGHSIGTKVNGFIIECALPDGKAQITVTLLTTKALGFAQSIDEINKSSFNETRAIFGTKVVDVVEEKKEPSVGPVILSTTFSISAPGANLPDLLDVIIFNPAIYAPIKMSFTSTTFGKCFDGTKARLDVHQVASTNDLNELVFTKEKVDILDEKGSNCRG